jgi:hypothetical protein
MPMTTSSTRPARRSARGRLVATLSALALVGGISAATGTAAHADEAPGEITVTATTGGDWINTAWRDENVTAGIKKWSAQCPTSHPYLKRYQSGTTTKNNNTNFRNPGGVIVHTAGLVDIEAYVDPNRTTRLGTMDGPWGTREYGAVRGVSGTYATWGGTAIQVVLHCVSDFRDGAMSPWEQSIGIPA